jgi:type III secretion system FlhB-like substrate exporter
MVRNRKYISVYFESAKQHGKKKGDITLAFDHDDALYPKVKALGSSEIKKIISVNSYAELLDIARREDRTVSNLIKHRLKVYLENEQKNTSG